jgi:glycosyltransferase involved in cell wall biosynthesis
MMTVAVIIPTFNHAHFLAEAIASVVAQTRPADEIIVIDDGSTDDPAAVVARFPGVRFIRRENRSSLPIARNTGLRSCTATHVIFLDADDRLLPGAIEAGVRHAAKHKDCAFVYGGFYQIFENTRTRGPDCYIAVQDNSYFELLKFNVISMLATALFRRECLIEVGGFDETLKRSEDYDTFLRLAQKYRFASHPTIIAEYRRHRENMSNDPVTMLAAVLHVLDRHEARIVGSGAEKSAVQIGRASWRDYYTWRMLANAYACLGSAESIRLIFAALKTSPGVFLSKVPARIVRRLAGGRLTEERTALPLAPKTLPTIGKGESCSSSTNGSAISKGRIGHPTKAG